MTIHDRVQELMTLLVVDDIDDEDRELAERHLLTCEQCRADLDALTALVPLLSQVEPPAHAAGVRPLAVLRHRRGRAGMAAVLLATAASLVLVVVLVASARREAPHHFEVQVMASSAHRGGLVWIDDFDDGLIVHVELTGLSDPPSGGMYEAWLHGARGLVSVGSFSPDGSGDVSVTLHGAGHLGDFGELIVTIEPDMVDPGINGTRIVLADLPRR